MIAVDIILVDEPISKQQLKEIAKEIYGDFVKAVVDVEKGIMAVSGELHADKKRFCWNETLVKKIFGVSTCILIANFPN